MTLEPHQRYVTDQAIEAYSAYVRERTAAGLPWKRSSEILSTYLQGEPVTPLFDDSTSYQN